MNLNMSLTLNFSLALCCMRFYMFSIKHLVTHRARYLFRHLRIIKKDRLKPVIENQTQECFYGYMSNWMLVYLCEKSPHLKHEKKCNEYLRWRWAANICSCFLSFGVCLYSLLFLFPIPG